MNDKSLLKANPQRVQSAQYAVVDILKFFFCIAVIFLHRASTMNNQTVFSFVVDVFSNLAVPFFSCASVFFLYKKLFSVDSETKKNKIFWKYIKRMTLLYVIWSVIYIIPTLYNDIVGASFSFKEIIAKYIEDIFVNGYTFIHLWYMQSLIIAVIIIFYLQKIFSFKTVSIICCLTFILFVFTENYHFFDQTTLLYKMFSAINNYAPDSVYRTLTELPIYIFLGMISAKKPAMQTKKIILPFLAIQILIIIFAIIKQNGDIWSILHRSLYPVYMFLLFQISIGLSMKPKKIYSYLRKMSALMYFVHWFVPIILLDGLFAAAGFGYELAYNAGIRFGITLAYSVIFSIIVIKLSQKEKFKFLKYLY